MATLPATTYNAPPRVVRKPELKTIRENEETYNFALRSDSEGDESDRTITARPPGLNAKLAQSSTARSRLSTTSSVSPIDSSPCSDIDERSYRGSLRSSYAGSDAGTVFSEDSCPSLTGSHDTTFYTNSSRNSVVSGGSAKRRNQYPSIIIPRDSWSENDGAKEITLALSPRHKVLLTPQALSALPQYIPAINAIPSFGRATSTISRSPSIPATSSAPVTPEMNLTVPAEGQLWGDTVRGSSRHISLEITTDEEHSIVISPSVMRSQRQSLVEQSTGYETDWSDIVVHFPQIPGATPQEHTPVEPDLRDIRRISQMPSDHGVQLPTDAFDLLRNLTRSYSPDFTSDKASTARDQYEMRQRSLASDTHSRPRSVVGVPMTPTFSEYSLSQLSIPSPGGFFNSLQSNTRATWCAGMQSRGPSAPSSATAEDFYNVPFKRSISSSGKQIETIIELPDAEHTDGPPTARQAGFVVPEEYRDDEVESEDMYGSGRPQVEPVTDSAKSSPRLEYDENYQQGLKQAAEVHVDRTSDWLSQQDTYLAELRDCDTHVDRNSYVALTPNPLNDLSDQRQLPEPKTKGACFLEEAAKSLTALIPPKAPLQSQSPIEAAFLNAFERDASQRAGQDTYLSASIRLDSINSTRLALPLQHVRTLLNTHSGATIQSHDRPKYRGPFNQNPRSTGYFQSQEQVNFVETERDRLATEQLQPAMWMIEAQKDILHKGQLLSCGSAAKRLTEMSKKLRASNKKSTLRILDLGGASSGSWAWSAAEKWSSVKVITAQTRLQADLASGWPINKEMSKPKRPENPANHKVITVPLLWRLPFRDNYFDVISARTLHMFLKSRPVAESSIDEWDLTFKECIRVLKPHGILDFITLDSRISNHQSNHSRQHTRDASYDSQNTASISPTAMGQSFKSPFKQETFANSQSLYNPQQFNFERELSKKSYDIDGGAALLHARLTGAGFTDVRKQNVLLPLGRAGIVHDNPAVGYSDMIDHHVTPILNAKNLKSKFGSVHDANGRSQTPFRDAPRPISEVSSVTKIIEQYANVEAVQGPVGSTDDIADMAGLLGSMMWEEWLVRLRLEMQLGRNGEKASETKTDDAEFEAANLLAGINDVLATGYARGSWFTAVAGWARKPGNPSGKVKIKNDVESEAASKPTLIQKASLAEINELFQLPIRRSINTSSQPQPKSLTVSQPLQLSPIHEFVPQPPQPNTDPLLGPESFYDQVYSNSNSTSDYEPRPESVIDVESYLARSQALQKEQEQVQQQIQAREQDENYDYDYDYTQYYLDSTHQTPLSAHNYNHNYNHYTPPNPSRPYYAQSHSTITPTQQVHSHQIPLHLDVNGVRQSPGNALGSPEYYTESAVERGEVGTIPMMIVE